jgi:hypothetical protein
MRKNNLQYYATHFGAFTPLSFKEISEYFNHEWFLLHPPEVLYWKQDRSLQRTNSLSAVESRTWLNKILSYSSN